MPGRPLAYYCLEDTAFRRRATSTCLIAGLNESFDLRSELGQLPKLFVYRLQMRLADHPHSPAICRGGQAEAKQLTNLVQGEIAAAAHEGQALDVADAVAPLSCRASLGFGQDADLFVIPDRRGGQPGTFGDLKNGQHGSTQTLQIGYCPSSYLKK